MFESLDVFSFNNGELDFKNGDIKIATNTQSLLNSINFCILTTLGDYKPKLDFGASPETFIGKPNNSENRNYMKMHIDYYLRTQGILDTADYNLQILPVSNHEVAVIMKINIPVFEFDPKAEPMETIIAYKYDFGNGTLEEVE